MKICHDQGCNDIGVVIASKSRHYLFYFSKIKNSRHWEPIQNRSQELFSPIRSSRWLQSLSKIYKSFTKIVRDEVFTVRNTVRKGKWWGLAVICRKRSAFDLQFHLIVVLIFLKTCMKDRVDSSSRLLERRIWLVCIAELLLAVL